MPRTCRTCGAEVADDARLCTVCRADPDFVSAAVEKVEKCPICNGPMSTHAAFCPHCGHPGQPAWALKTSVTDVHMPFGSMVIFMFKWALAAIPALLLLSVVVLSVFGGLGGLAALNNSRAGGFGLGPVLVFGAIAVVLVLLVKTFDGKGKVPEAPPQPK